jgi:ketosteroid isomerase-like protein
VKDTPSGHPIKTGTTALALIAAMLTIEPARAAPRDDILATYQQFAAAQNARDIPTVRALLLDSPQFLWVSNGQSFWGRETMIARMSSYQRAEVWRAQPDLDRAVIVEVSSSTGYVHLPLALQVGSTATGVAETQFLVSALFASTPQGWKIAALFTTISNTD